VPFKSDKQSCFRPLGVLGWQNCVATFLYSKNFEFLCISPFSILAILAFSGLGNLLCFYVRSFNF